MNALSRVLAMDALWNDAAGALSRRDYPEFDRIMLRFRELRTQSSRDSGVPNKQPETNNGH